MNAISSETNPVLPAAPGSGSDPSADRKRKLVLATVMLGAFMALLDTTIVNVALPTMQRELHSSNSELSWTVSGYALAFGLVLIPAGRLGDSMGRRPLYIAGLWAFLVASLAAGLSQSPTWLIGARVTQGAGAGVFYTQINATIVDTFPGPARRRAFGVVSAVIGLSTATGPLLGGLLIAGFGSASGWRWVFLINLVVGAVALPAAYRFLPSRPRTQVSRPDYVAAMLLCVGLMLILFPLIDAQNHGWKPAMYVCIAVSVPTLFALARWELRAERTGRVPLIPPRLVRRPSFSSGTIFALIYFASFTSIFFVFVIVWQDGFRHSALMTGTVGSSFAAGQIIGAKFSSRLTERLGRRILVVGCGIVAVGLASLITVVHIAGPDPSVCYVVPPLLVAGLGNGLTLAPNVAFTLAGLPPADNGAASGVLNTGQRIGSAFGIAIVATVLFGTLNPAGTSDSAIAAAFSNSFQLAMLANLGFVLIALLLIVVMPQKAEATVSSPIIG